MSVSDPNVIDFAAWRGRAELDLVIADHLDWDDEAEHLSVLQEKINRYIACIESDELFARVPEARGCSCGIVVMLAHEPSTSGIDFLRHVKNTLEDAGIRFVARILSETVAVDVPLGPNATE